MIGADAGLHVTYRGRTYPAVPNPPGRVVVFTDSPQDFPDADESGCDSDGESWVRLAYEVLDRRWARTWYASLDGVEVQVGSVRGTRTTIHTGDPAVAQRLDMDGDQYMMWHLEVPTAALTDWYHIDTPIPLPNRSEPA